MNAAGRLFNLATLLLLGMTLVACLGAGAIFANPDVAFNPFKPPHEPTSLPLPTQFTPAPSATVTVSATMLPTSTPTATPTIPTSTPSTRTPFPTPVGPTETLTPTDLPTWTPTRPRPGPTVTPHSYPADATATVGTPQAYP